MSERLCGVKLPAGLNHHNYSRQNALSAYQIHWNGKKQPAIQLLKNLLKRLTVIIYNKSICYLTGFCVCMCVCVLTVFFETSI